ncbi:MAG: SPFH domain-containing protein [Candidatus Lokiarchaeota archaeon]|nr:SPFH domain-containing protein [Candidatus Lokiarchaeota archaeon]
MFGREVVEWKNAKKEDIVYKYPDERLSWGATIIVKENQWAVFYRDGKAYDVFQAGRHVISTADVPLLGKILKAVSGNVFQANVIYVSRAQFDGKFGGQGQTQELAPLKFNGQYWFKVADPQIFVNEICGNQSVFTSEAVNDYLRGFFNEHLIDTLSGYTLRAVYGKLDETSLSCKVKLRKDFERIGLELVDLKFMKIDTDEKYRERLFFMQTGGVGGAGVLEAETRKGMAESLGKSPGAAMGAGMMMMGPGGMAQPGFAGGGGGGTPVRSCQKCGAQSPVTSKFCNNCGAKFPGDEGGDGGAKVPKFCPECGAKTEGAKFCPECGKKLA